MPATPLTPTLRYLPAGVRKYNWLTAVASTTAPTRAEINAGTDLTGEIAAVNGFEIVTPVIDVTAFGDLFSVQVPGIPVASDPCEIVFYASSSSADVRTVLPAGTAGFLLRARPERHHPIVKERGFAVKGPGFDRLAGHRIH